jgi:uncharacterized protein (TIGR02600 family)
MVVIMTVLVITVFIGVTGERRAAGSKLQGMSAAHLASSAPQFLISQIRDATTSGNTWASQPGMVRTYAAGGAAAGVYKLYSAGRVFASGASFVETEDAPPNDWNAGPNGAIYCDINRPAADALGGLHYSVVDPTAAATSGTNTMSGSAAVPGFALTLGSAPGYVPANPASPTNNPLPMPVRWLYILADGAMAVPDSVGADGKVSFPSGTMPSKGNPVVGRVAFWADDDTSKININTAGYAKNDAAEWTFWDTPYLNTPDEKNFLSWAQPWTNEYQRYPGHPATTGLNVVFDSMNLTANQTLLLTPRYKDGGTKEGTVRVTAAPTSAQTAGLLKNERLFASVDEMFYNKDRGLNTAGVAAKDLEARRFLLTANSRAPEVTLWNTPRVTIWPTWKDAGMRTPLDRLIAFASTLAGQPFYFVRGASLSTSTTAADSTSASLSTRELLDIPSNLALWNYLKSLSKLPVPGFGGDFESKYGAGNRDQILTSIHDAIRLANLDDRSSPGSGATSTWSFTAGELRLSGGKWSPYPNTRDYQAGYVAPTEGPGGTWGAGRTSTLAEVAFLFARPSNITTPDASGIREIDKVKAAALYGFYAPAAGFVFPAQNRRVRITGLGSFTVQKRPPPALPTPPDPTDPAQQLFVNDVYDRTELDTCTPTNISCRRELGGRIEWSVSQQVNPPGMSTFGPPTANVVLPIDTANPNSNPFYFSGGTLTVEVFSPATSATPYQTYRITFPPASALTPMPAVDSPNAFASWSSGGRWMPLDSGNFPNLYEGRISRDADTVLAMQSRTGDFRSEVLRKDVISDFQPHYRYGKTDILSFPSAWSSLWPGGSRNYLSRRASSLPWSYVGGSNVFDLPPDPVLSQIRGQLISGFSGHTLLGSPLVPSGSYPNSIQDAFPPGDFSSGPGSASDGSLSPKTDEGGQVEVEAGASPYFRGSAYANRQIAPGTLSSPNRQMPSAIYFGSIPTGLYPDPGKSTSTPWRTLLFRPARAYHMGGAGHFGATSPADYLMLDWFHMPVVEPYAISEPFSTAGKINLNARIMPFGDYVRRETALHAVLRSSRVTAVPESLAGVLGALPAATTRYTIDVEETLGLLRKRFDGTDGSGKRVYLTNAEICSIDLVPQGFTASTLASFWADKRTTGDNLREGAYATLLPRLTAKSNTFTAHVTAQALQTAEADGGWREGRGVVGAEWRGSFGVERYIDPNDSKFIPSSPNYAGAAATDFLSGTVSIEPFYKFRILGERRFMP